ncbi:aminopeptidase N [Sphingomonas sp. ABOLD]|uniref:Aminopeptidase N n=1 Tax=Sphingomonas trueperi TaxID=53317 RepID=A0A7X5Y3L2_9SPHN|nr:MULTISPECIES: aminopeptidase N [Sphingomonas]NJB99140.1 aminopeptidase N [Sphingomonas trueperi]RSV45414.1 aminopeptidase N [Sphingomonas sp. ABOLE]RSV46231.1 aminopeptidase N [Sphingomonas sp. ABOLD]
MSDARIAAAAPQAIRREDYRQPDWLVPEIALDFDLDPAATRVRATLHVTRNGAHDRALVLNGDGLEAASVKVDGVAAQNWRMDGQDLVIPLTGDAHTIETEVVIAPERNTQLQGLYASSGMLCTQCEAEGFRRITFFPDRPDVLSKYKVRMTADKARFPVLLANGDPIAQGPAEGGRHWAEWHDPFPKPSYLFALVAGDLVANTGSFTTMSGREVQLGIYVRAPDLPKTDHALHALKLSMKWDEDVYGREYDLDVFNIVAVDDFNFGAMENKGLNVFNSRYILADPDTATDWDYDAIAAVVAHEYFHNWSGNRVTCRDWFQLSLKEGFTVFRDQSFSADQGSAAVKRIEDVRSLRASQFPEDAGPLAHPVRPDEYIEISNFYTATIYNKGAELIRMMATILGPQKFRAATDLYFDRFDGTAATCEDFVASMEEAGGVDLGQFRRWYSQAGTPRVSANLVQDGATTRLALAQTVPPTPGQPVKEPMVLPLKIRLFGEKSGAPLTDEQLVLLDKPEQELRFEGLPERAVLSINRGFSAPVIVDANRSAADLAFLSAHDDDPFARYEAMQQLMLDTLVAAVTTGKGEHGALIDAVRNTLTDPSLDRAFIAEAVLLPSDSFIGDQMAVVDPDAIFRAREALRADLGNLLEPEWRAAYEGARANRFEYSPAAKGARRLKNVALGYIAASGAADAAELAYAQFDAADNMTDRQGGLATLVNGTSSLREKAIQAFYQRYAGNALVLDKWFQTQALSSRDDTLAAVEKLARHPDFTLANPNRARALVGAFSINQRAFHDPSGRGYRFVADQLIALDKLNPQTAAKLVPPLGRWKRFDADRAAKMRGELERIVASPGLSKDMFEQATKSLD